MPPLRPNEKKLFTATAKGDFVSVYRLLKEGLTADIVDNYNFTAAGRAVQHGATGVLKVMLNSGLDPNLTGIGGVSLLHVCALFNKYLAAKILMQSGADPSRQSEAGRRPADEATDTYLKQLLSQESVLPDDPDQFEVGEQVFAKDRKGIDLPAVIEENNEPNKFLVHFIGFSKRENIEVSRESLTKVSAEEVERYIMKIENAAQAKSKTQRGRPPKTPIKSSPLLSVSTPPASANKQDFSTNIQKNKFKRSAAELDSILPPSKVAKESTVTIDVNNILNALNQCAEKIAFTRDQVSKLQGEDVSAKNDIRSTEQVEELLSLQKENKVLKQKLEELQKDFKPLPSPAAMMGSAALREEGDRLNLIANLRTRCYQLEAERDRYKRLMELTARNSSQLPEPAASASTTPQEKEEDSPKENDDSVENKSKTSDTNEDDEIPTSEKVDTNPVLENDCEDVFTNENENEYTPTAASTEIKNESEETKDSSKSNQEQPSNEPEATTDSSCDGMAPSAADANDVQEPK